MAQRTQNGESSAPAAPLNAASVAVSVHQPHPQQSPANVYAAGRGPPPLIKGSSVPDGRAAVRLVQDYALYHNKQVRVACRGGKHRKLICTSDTCPFYVQFYQRHSKNGDRSWYLSSFDTSHSATCTSTAKPTRRQLTEMASFKEALVNTPGVSAASLATYVGSQSHVPLRMNLRTVYRAKEAVRNTLFDRQAQSFRRIPALLSQFLALNNGSYATHDVDEDGCFVRAFIACGVFTQATPNNQQVFGFECVPVEGMFPGAQLYLLGKDSNRKTLVVAAAVISVETQAEALSFDHLAWFFRCVHAAGVDIQSCTILSTSSPALLDVETELGLKFRLCTRHLIETELSSIPSFRNHHHALVWGLQASETVHEYDNRLQWIATTCGENAAACLRQLPPERWAVAGTLNDHQPPLYGWRSRDFSDGSDSSEQFHALATRLKAKLPIDFLDGIMESWVQAAYERSSSYETWIQSGLQVTPGAQELYNREFQRASDFMATRSSPSVVYVSPVQSDPMSSGANSGRCRVDLSSGTCTCVFIQQHSIPCRHLITALMFCNQMDTVKTRFASIYRVSSYGAAYHNKMVELPLQDDLTESEDCRPPRRHTKRSRGTARASLLAQPLATTSDQPTLFDELASPSTEHQEQLQANASSAAAGKARKRPRQAGGELLPANNSTHTELSLRIPPRCSKCKATGHNARSCTAGR